MKIRIPKNKTAIAVAALLLVGMVSFQNCAKVNFNGIRQSDSASDMAAGFGPSTDQFLTNEDTPLSAKITSVSVQTGTVSKFVPLSSPTSGTISNFNDKTGEFTYTPNSHFFGNDQFQYTEENGALVGALTRTVAIQVGRTGLPFVISDLFNVDMNSPSTAMAIEVGDNEVPNPWSDISSDGSATTVQTQNGTVTKDSSGKISYQPNADFRGTDKVLVFALDSKGGMSSKQESLVVGNPLSNLQPGMAVRSANCLQCHAQISSNFVTDFGYGSSYYFAHDQSSPISASWVYSLLVTNDASGYYPDWITSTFGPSAQLIVPKADLGFKFADTAPNGVDKSAPWLQATTIVGLMTSMQSIPGSAFKATVTEKSSVYIGTPTVSDITSAGSLDATHPIRYYKNADNSYALSGLSLAAGGYYTNTDVVTCDGDLFVNGTVFLNTLNLKTISGCRLHATGPIFIQKGITYTTDPTLATNANLQLVSARVISMGVGLSQCEAQTDPAGWYNASHVANPLNERLVVFPVPYGIKTRNTDSTSGVALTAANTTAEGQYIVGEAQKIVGFDDASCHGRAQTFERLMLVAPQIHSRYKGNFSGVVIAEFPLFSLGNFVYQFDPVFSKVSILPFIDSSKYLSVK